MSISMFILRPSEKIYKTVCPVCAANPKKEVLDVCPICHGTAIQKHKIFQYDVVKNPIVIEHIDRDPETGILRYWENTSEFFYETTYPDIHPYTPQVPHGIHLCHYTYESAKTECRRINEILKNFKVKEY